MKDKIKTADVIAAYELLAKYKLQVQEEIKQREEEIKQLDKEIQGAKVFSPDTTLQDADISVRLYNILYYAIHSSGVVAKTKDGWGKNAYTIRDASKLSIKELSRVRNCGKIALDEFKKLITSAGLTFKP